MSGTLKDIKAEIVIGMPSHRGTVTTQTLVSLMNLQQCLLADGLNSHFLNIDYAEITHSRNIIANFVHRHPEYTHLLFIDDDMAFEANLISDLVLADKPLVGAVCPKRSIDLHKFYEAAVSGASFDQAKAEALTFVVRFLPNTRLEIIEGWVEMAGIGMGITLIRRDVLDTMVERGVAPDRWGGETAPEGTNSQYRYGFFDGIYDETLKAMLSEDLSFCERWRSQCGGQVWGNANHHIGHVGQMVYSGRYFDRLIAGKL